jgi:hypothetical protein
MIIPYDTFPISESYLIKHSLHTFHTGRSVSKDRAIRFLDEDMTDLEMYILFSPFGRIAPRGASARIDKDGTIQERLKNDLPGESTVRYSVLISPGSQPEQTGRNRTNQEVPDGFRVRFFQLSSTFAVEMTLSTGTGTTGTTRTQANAQAGFARATRYPIRKVGENVDKR